VLLDRYIVPHPTVRPRHAEGRLSIPSQVTQVSPVTSSAPSQTPPPGHLPHLLRPTLNC